MLLNVALSCALVIITTVVHATAMAIMFRLIKRSHVLHPIHATGGKRVTLVALVVLVFFFISLAEALIWAGAYLAIGAMSQFEPALYFSMVTFTTLGYGDVVLEDQWRLLASLEAANGMLMLGWTTGVIVAVVHRIYVPTGSAEDARF